MDVEPAVKSTVLALAFLAAASDSTAQDVQVFGAGIDVRENCEVIVSRRDKQPETLQSASSPTGKCRILSHSETNIPRVEFIQGEYVLLVEYVVTPTDTCRAKLAAITITRDGRVRLSTKTQSTSACGAAERKDFEILRYRSRN